MGKNKVKDICLVDVDSSIPNLALMKLSKYFKSQGHNITFKKLDYNGYNRQSKKKCVIDAENFDEVYVSTIFTCNKDVIEVINCDHVQQGGTGVDINLKLPYEIEHSYPDYDLYPENKYSMGFLTRGCIRNCDFCFVPKKEGFLKLNCDLKEFFNPKLPKIMLLDNNFFAYKDCVQLMQVLQDTGKKITFKQGLDIRLVTEEKAKALSKLKYDGDLSFAFDNYKEKDVILQKLRLLRKYIGNSRVKFYVLVGFNSTLLEDLERIRILKEKNCLPYIMRYETCYESKDKFLYTDMASWCNQPALFKRLSFKEYITKKHTKQRLKQTMDIIDRNNLNKYLQIL